MKYLLRNIVPNYILIRQAYSNNLQIQCFSVEAYRYIINPIYITQIFRSKKQYLLSKDLTEVPSNN
jgi:transcription antitermination factor NusG